MPDYGIDFAGVEDLDFNLTTVTGPMVVAQRVARRLITPFLFYDREHDLDIRQYLGGQVSDPGSLAARIEASAMLDEAVQNARARVSFVDERLDIELRLVLAEGPFDFVVTVDALSVQLLSKN